jgi:hypothetical protein
MFFFALFATCFLHYVLRTVLAYVQNAAGILVRPLRQKSFQLNISKLVEFTLLAYRHEYQLAGVF